MTQLYNEVTWLMVHRVRCRAVSGAKPTKNSICNSCWTFYLNISRMKGAKGSEHLEMKANRKRQRKRLHLLGGRMLSTLATGRLLYHFIRMPWKFTEREKKKICLNATQKRTRSVTWLTLHRLRTHATSTLENSWCDIFVYFAVDGTEVRNENGK